MKKFHFPLDTVLDYKQQVLSSLQTEHGAILAQLRQQEEVLARLEDQYYQADAQFTQRKMEGINIADALSFEQYLRAMEHKLNQENRRLLQIMEQEEAKRREVVSAKQDTSSIEKLRERKLETYNKSVRKGEEQMIEEYVSTQRAMSGA